MITLTLWFNRRFGGSSGKRLYRMPGFPFVAISRASQSRLFNEDKIHQQFPLYEEHHIALRRRMVDSRWITPLHYASQTTNIMRYAADWSAYVSHMQTIVDLFRASRTGFLRYSLANDAGEAQPKVAKPLLGDFWRCDTIHNTLLKISSAR